jgi:oligoribonuclease
MLPLRRTLFSPLNRRCPLPLSRKMANMANPRTLYSKDGPMVWIDCEMTGLDPKKDVLLEIAVIITNGDLKRVDPGISRVIKTEKKVLDE